MFGQMFLQLGWTFTRGGAEMTGDHPEAALVGLVAAPHQVLPLLLLPDLLVALQVSPEVVRLDKPFPALRRGTSRKIIIIM